VIALRPGRQVVDHAARIADRADQPARLDLRQDVRHPDDERYERRIDQQAQLGGQDRIRIHASMSPIVVRVRLETSLVESRR
jgi:hypothetical protein